MLQLKTCREVRSVFEAGGDTSSEDYMNLLTKLMALEKDFGDWEGDILEYTKEERMALPFDICKAVGRGDIPTVLNWLGPLPVDKLRLNARMESNNDMTLLFHAIMFNNFDLMSILLQSGADVNYQSANGSTPLFHAAGQPEHYEKARLLLEWGAEYVISPEAIMTQEKGLTDKELFIRTLVGINTKLTPLIKSEFGGRRCELINLVNNQNLNGRACVDSR